jgi:hypothetical protein
MTMLGIGLFQGIGFKPQLGTTTVPNPGPVALHFDLGLNTAPTGADITLTFDVPPPV